MPISQPSPLPFSHFPQLTLDELRQALSERENHLRSINGWLSIVTLISDINKLKLEISLREQEGKLLPEPEPEPEQPKKPKRSKSSRKRKGKKK